MISSRDSDPEDLSAFTRRSSSDLVQDDVRERLLDQDGARERLLDHDGARGAVDPRILAAWDEWLGALATNAEAALAAAHVYGDLTAGARDAWLDALAEDGARLSVPRVAIYAPLLSVESDPRRRQRIEDAIGEDVGAARRRPLWALRGFARDGARVAALVSPLYLGFVRVLYCRYIDEGFVWARHEPLLAKSDAPGDGLILDDIRLEPTPTKLVVEDLAHAILAQTRRGAELPSALQHFVDLFDAHIDGESFT
jgi:hypothetical protein